MAPGLDEFDVIIRSCIVFSQSILIHTPINCYLSVLHTVTSSESSFNWPVPWVLSRLLAINRIYLQNENISHNLNIFKNMFNCAYKVIHSRNTVGIADYTKHALFFLHMHMLSIALHYAVYNIQVMQFEDCAARVIRKVHTVKKHFSMCIQTYLSNKIAWLQLNIINDLSLCLIMVNQQLKYDILQNKNFLHQTFSFGMRVLLI